MGALVALGLAAPTTAVVGAGALDVAATVAGVAYVLSQAAQHSEAPQHAPDPDDEAYPMPQYLREADWRGTVNIGIFGPSGAGKSTLVNTLRGLRPGQPGAAEVGAQETTVSPAMYRYGDLEAARLWDIPGAGTQRFPLASYIRDMGLRFFDVAILVSATRVTHADHSIARALRGFRVPCLVVRSKVDVDIRNEQEDHGRAPQATKAALHDEVMQRFGDVLDVYLVSKEPHAHDLPRLRQSLLAYVCANRRVRPDDSLCPICVQPFTIFAGGPHELVTCRSCKGRVCGSCVDSIRSDTSFQVTCPFCCGPFMGGTRASTAAAAVSSAASAAAAGEEADRLADAAAATGGGAAGPAAGAGESEARRELAFAEASWVEGGARASTAAVAVSSAASAAAAGEEADRLAAAAAGGAVGPAEPRRELAFAEGSWVEVHGLVGATHLNGRRGRVSGRRQEGRVGVDLDPPFGAKALRVENLKLIAQTGFVAQKRSQEA